MKNPTPIQEQIEFYVTGGFGYYQKVDRIAKEPEIEMKLKLARMDFCTEKMSLDEYYNFVIKLGKKARKYDMVGRFLDKITGADELKDVLTGNN